MNIKYFSYFLVILLLAIFFGTGYNSCKNRQERAENDYNNFCTNYKYKKINIRNFKKNNEKKEINDEEQISKIWELIKYASKIPIKKAKLYDISVEIIFIDDKDKIYKFNIFKDKEDSLAHIIFVSEYKSIVLSTNDNNNILNSILSF